MCVIRLVNVAALTMLMGGDVNQSGNNHESWHCKYIAVIMGADVNKGNNNRETWRVTIHHHLMHKPLASANGNRISYPKRAPVCVCHQPGLHWRLNNAYGC